MTRTQFAVALREAERRFNRRSIWFLSVFPLIASLGFISDGVKRGVYPQSYETAAVAVLLAFCGLVFGAIIATQISATDRYGLRCPSCRRSLFAQHRSSITLATGHCEFCGARVFDENADDIASRAVPTMIPKLDFIRAITAFRADSERTMRWSVVTLLIALAPVIPIRVMMEQDSRLIPCLLAYVAVVIGLAILLLARSARRDRLFTWRSLLDCPHCRCRMFHFAKVVIASNHCTRCGRQVLVPWNELALGDGKTRSSLVPAGEFESATRRSEKESNKAGIYLLIPLVVLIVAAILLGNESSAKRGNSPLATVSGVLIGSSIATIVVAVSVLDRTMRRYSISCPSCRKPLSTPLVRATGNCGHCGGRVLCDWPASTPAAPSLSRVSS